MVCEPSYSWGTFMTDPSFQLGPPSPDGTHSCCLGLCRLGKPLRGCNFDVVRVFSLGFPTDGWHSHCGNFEHDLLVSLNMPLLSEAGVRFVLSRTACSNVIFMCNYRYT